MYERRRHDQEDRPDHRRITAICRSAPRRPQHARMRVVRHGDQPNDRRPQEPRYLRPVFTARASTVTTPSMRVNSSTTETGARDFVIPRP